MLSGYGTKWVNGKITGAHRAYYQEYKGMIPKKLFVCHSCDVKLCVNPRHLFLGTCLTNTRDAMQKGRLARGERCPGSKLKEADIRKIRHLHKRGELFSKDIAKMYCVSRSLISNIVNRKIWTHV